ncbi:aminotransferase class V-fold PLP-dependent enzyme [Allosaccharopolyspora coralli]|uniref:Aminotransferase class V-fold PLP-dependent enzyme n=1 Tax=Allosaccharopolyspora coralli TaxID=2665642 RepID=A0A5Q3QAE5_9PSEU|nr:alanine--glyoxylate aminotransferase family protein [Allosaccharopolyspora coralli]QGK70164.1 aminotransferase class V-fold PLP-dependent enzyme [Allosaccharopolyspora coralli]
MALVERSLLGPGPTNAYPEATAGLAAPMLGHLDPEFLAMLDETGRRLRTVWGTGNLRTLPLSGTGSIGMEAAFVNFVHPGDVVVVAVNGLFGERMCDVASRYGAEVVRVDHTWGQPVDVERVLAAHPSPSIVAAVHAETSTGVRSDIEHLGAALRERDERTLLLADCVTSIGGEQIDLDGWNVDIAYAGTQKCLGVPPGLAPFTVSERAWHRRVEKPTTWYLDLGLIGNYVTGGGSGGRAYHHTAPTAMVASLHAALGRLLEEGIAAAAERHREAGEALQTGLQEMGLDLFAAEGNRLHQLTSVVVPDHVDSADVRKRLLNDYGIEIGGGVGQYANTVWRIGLMGPNAGLDRVELLLGSLRRILGR